jgi:hypothetical protein
MCVHACGSARVNHLHAAAKNKKQKQNKTIQNNLTVCALTRPRCGQRRQRIFRVVGEQNVDTATVVRIRYSQLSRAARPHSRPEHRGVNVTCRKKKKVENELYNNQNEFCVARQRTVQNNVT